MDCVRFRFLGSIVTVTGLRYPLRAISCTTLWSVVPGRVPIGGVSASPHPTIRRLRTYVSKVRSPPATVAMGDTIDKALGLVIRNLSDKNYAESLASYRFWFDIGQTYYQISPDKTFDVIWKNRAASSSIDVGSGQQLIHSNAHSIVRFAADAESGHAFGPHSPGLQSRLCARSLQEFFSDNVAAVWSGSSSASPDFYADANFIAHWANLGYLEEAAIRDHILQSLTISRQTLACHQADALIILFKLAGATFEAYADPSVVNRCFELLKNCYPQDYYDYNGWKRQLIQVSAPHEVKGGHRAEANFQELFELRERGWEGLPPPPVFMTGKSKLTGENQKDPAATPIATSLGLPNKDVETYIPQPSPLESVTAQEADPIPTSLATPVIHSPSISIATLSDFTIADTSDDESSIDPTTAGISDDESPIDPTTITPHETFYLEDGNVEVLCGNTLFRVSTSTLSFHSPAFRRMFVKENMASAESPNGCPRILSSDTAKDFTTLLKMIYLPGSVNLLACC